MSATPLLLCVYRLVRTHRTYAKKSLDPPKGIGIGIAWESLARWLARSLTRSPLAFLLSILAASSLSTKGGERTDKRTDRRTFSHVSVCIQAEAFAARWSTDWDCVSEWVTPPLLSARISSWPFRLEAPFLSGPWMEEHRNFEERPVEDFSFNTWVEKEER